MKRNIYTYTIPELKKMNTDRLLSIFVKMYNQYPPNIMDRDYMLTYILREIRKFENPNYMSENVYSNSVEREEKIVTQILTDLRNIRDNVKVGNNMSDHEVRTIRSMYKGGCSYQFIADQYNKKPNYIRNIVIGKLYKSVS